MIDTYEAGITLKVKHGKRYPGDLIPEAADFPTLGVYLNSDHVRSVMIAEDDYVAGILDLFTRGEIDDEQYTALLERFGLATPAHTGDAGGDDLESLTTAEIRARLEDAGIAEDDMPSTNLRKSELIEAARELLG